MTPRPVRWFARAIALSAAILMIMGRPALVVARQSHPLASVTTGQARLDAFAQHLAMKAASPFKDLKWRWLGPRNLSGRSTDIAVVQPRGASFTMYVGTASGGMWKTDNEATRWQPVFEQAAATAIGAVAIAPSNQNIVWVGTGESILYRSSQEGAGVYKSTDAGRTWQSMGLADTFVIARIVVHPTNPDIVYVATAGHAWTPNPERGVYETTDGGRTWQRVLYIDEESGAIDIAMDPADPNTLYAATWQRTRLKWRNPRTYAGYTGSGIHKTTDGGRTWTDISHGLPAPDKRGRIGLSICLTKPSVVYAVVDDNDIARQPTAAERESTYGLPVAGIPRGATVYRSDDRGAHWIQVSGRTPEQQQLMGALFDTFGFVFGQIRVDPNDADIVYVLGRWINVSHDGGKTFTTMVTPGGDYHGMWIDPGNSNYLVTASDTGVDITYDRGATWKSALTGAAFPWAPDVGQQGLPVTQFYNVAYDMATPFHVYGSAQDFGSYRGVVDLSGGRNAIPAVDFERMPGGEGSTHAIDPLDPSLVYTSGVFGRAQRVDLTKPRPLFSFTTVPTRYADEPPFRGQWLAPIVLSPHSSQIVYLGLQYVLRSRDRADTWDVISPDLSRRTAAETGDVPYHTIFTISESTLRAGLLYAGTDDGRAHVTKDGGGSWTDVSAGLVPGKWVSRVVASAFDIGTVYLTQNGKRDENFTPYVWKSTDFGHNWTGIAAGIPTGPVNVIREDPLDPNILYVGTDTGVYVTSDGGSTWNVLGGNLPAVYVHDLIVHPRDNIVVIATHGRGMWALEVDAVNRTKK